MPPSPSQRFTSDGTAWREVRDSHPGQRQAGAGHRGVIDSPGRAARSPATGTVQELPVPSGELEDGAAGNCEGRVSSGGIVPASWVHCDEPDAASRAVVRFYNKRGTAEQWIKEGKQAVKMTRLSCHRFRSNEVRLWLSLIAYKPGEPMAAAGPADEDRQLVADKLATTAGEDGRKAGETRSVLLAPTGGEPPDAAAVWGHPRQDRGVALSSRIGEPMPGSDFGDERGRGAARCRDHRLERRQFTAVEASGEVEQVAHVLAESLNGQNPTGRLHSEALRHTQWAVPKLKMEIPGS